MLQLSGITKSYGQLPVLRGIDLVVEPGQLVALLGSSGAGKTTLLQIAGTLDRPDAGSLAFEGRDILRLPERQVDQFRNRQLGFIFQFHHLLGEFTALENVMIPALVAGHTRKAAEARGGDLLARLGLAHRADHRPTELSGGEQQRVAVARALINQPRLILADEPTGNLDSANSVGLFQLFRDLAATDGVALLVATHNEALVPMAHRTIRMRDGRILESEAP